MIDCFEDDISRNDTQVHYRPLRAGKNYYRQKLCFHLKTAVAIDWGGETPISNEPSDAKMR